MATTLNDLGRNLFAQLNEIVTGGDDVAAPSTNKFISWCMPGLPFTEEDFAFCEKGFSANSAEELKSLYQQAFNFSQLIDFIPDRTGIYNNDMQQTVWSTSEARLSHLYGELLTAAKVVSYEIPEEDKAKIEKFRNLLRTTKKVKNLVTEEEKEVVEPGPVQVAYDQALRDYLTAATDYNNKRVAAQAATGQTGIAAVADWANNANLYRLKVKAANDAWVSGGYKNEVDQMNAFINQVTGRDAMLWIQRLKEYYNGAIVDGIGNGQVFFNTSLLPGNFFRSSGWTGYGVSHETRSDSTHSESTGWSAGANVNFGFFSVGGGVNSQSDEYSANYALSSFKLSFELTQVVISRPWFYPEFFMNRGWTLRPGEGWNYSTMPSDGLAPPDGPNGNFIAYPTTVLFARNIKIESAEFSSAYNSYSSSVGGSASVGWGPFSLSGSYSHSESDRKYNSTSDGQTLTVPGMQIIGFVNHVIGKSPNPLPEIPESDFH